MKKKTSQTRIEVGFLVLFCCQLILAIVDTAKRRRRRRRRSSTNYQSVHSLLCALLWPCFFYGAPSFSLSFSFFSFQHLINLKVAARDWSRSALSRFCVSCPCTLELSSVPSPVGAFLYGLLPFEVLLIFSFVQVTISPERYKTTILYNSWNKLARGVLCRWILDQIYAKFHLKIMISTWDQLPSRGEIVECKFYK